MKYSILFIIIILMICILRMNRRTNPLIFFFLSLHFARSLSISLSRYRIKQGLERIGFIPAINIQCLSVQFTDLQLRLVEEKSTLPFRTTFMNILLSIFVSSYEFFCNYFLFELLKMENWMISRLFLNVWFGEIWRLVCSTC